jgi:hypothetical protein
MKCSYRMTGALAVLAFALVLPASASSISGGYDASLLGVKNSTAQGNFSFNTSTDRFTGSLSFNGAFTGTANINQTLKCLAGICNLLLAGSLDGNKIIYDFLLNLNSDTFTAGGNIWNGKSDGSFGAKGYASMPEGGSTLAYLSLADLVIFGGISLARFGRATLQS